MIHGDNGWFHVHNDVENHESSLMPSETYEQPCLVAVSSQSKC